MPQLVRNYEAKDCGRVLFFLIEEEEHAIIVVHPRLDVPLDPRMLNNVANRIASENRRAQLKACSKPGSRWQGGRLYLEREHNRPAREWVTTRCTCDPALVSRRGHVRLG